MGVDLRVGLGMGSRWDRVHTNVPEKKSRTFLGLLLHFFSRAFIGLFGVLLWF